ncbi:Transcriptional regulator LytR [Lentibacillus sp. JNUCC-1]|uniref:LCP family protein n=1 Tax=Lentibacillus sp. JNUCC-1 TaxID=2654513 RepID=UPI0012E796F1|nr:LCP family protein [Lentibacillus sp. JNUCC-1]MUV37303.1 Transcriptional regulator LytR [Lentibacillus sp. JNUCC-1]
MTKHQNVRSARRNKLRRRRRRLWLILMPFLLAFIGVGVYAGSLWLKADSVFSDAVKDIDREKSDLRDEAVDPGKHNVSILIMGIDISEKRKNDGDPRSDSMMLATLNKEEKSVKLLSMPRDSYVYIPYKDIKTRINHAHAYGGPKAAMETVEHLLDVPVDYFVTLNFEAFIQVVEDVGGVTIDVPYEIWEQDSKDRKNAIHLMPGEQKLNGEEALAFARTRKYDNDIERGKRQQEVIKAVMKQSLSLGSVFKIDDMIESVGENMETNMEFSEMNKLLSYGLKGGGPDLETFTLHGHDSTGPGGMYLYQLDEEALGVVEQELKSHLEVE